MRELRRVVTGHDAGGKAVVTFDGAPPSGAGSVSDIWKNAATPARNDGEADAAAAPVRLAPPDGGAVFRYFQVPPKSASAGIEAGDLKAMVRDRFKDMGAEDALVAGPHPAMHRTRTVDYIVLLKGKVTLILDEEEVALEPFDTVVQRGTSHAWVNHGDEPALLAGVLIDAEAL